jgi:hypothetical protein
MCISERRQATPVATKRTWPVGDTHSETVGRHPCSADAGCDAAATNTAARKKRLMYIDVLLEGVKEGGDEELITARNQ